MIQGELEILIIFIVDMRVGKQNMPARWTQRWYIAAGTLHRTSSINASVLEIYKRLMMSLMTCYGRQLAKVKICKYLVQTELCIYIPLLAIVQYSIFTEFPINLTT